MYMYKIYIRIHFTKFARKMQALFYLCRKNRNLFRKNINEKREKGDTLSKMGVEAMVYYGNSVKIKVSGGQVASCLLLNLSLGVMVYPWLEIWYRGYTHISMAMAGGLAMAFFAALGFFRLSRPSKMLLSCLFVLILELNIGLICNMMLGLSVWDYTALPFSFCGQICLFYALLWFMLALPFGILAERLSLLLLRLMPSGSPVSP